MTIHKLPFCKKERLPTMGKEVLDLMIKQGYLTRFEDIDGYVSYVVRQYDLS